MKTDYRLSPPKKADDVEIVEQRDGDRLAFIVGSPSAGRFILLRETEARVLQLLTGSRSLLEVCEQFKRLYGSNLTSRTLIKFLTKLDEAGILAGERSVSLPPSDLMPGVRFYLRFKLFNPDRLFSRMIPALRWIWTPGFVIFTLLLLLAAIAVSLLNWAELKSYSLYTLREHYVAIFIAGTFVAFAHEFAHGLTCKAFGGRTPEVGVLLIYYFFPGLYCNVSGIHVIPQRSRRLWVIAAGVYWQVLVGVVALLAWFLIAPHTLLSDLAFIFFLGSVIDVVFNANPLIKLDGYYFLSQWLRLPNLMDRSRAYWRGLLRQLLSGKRDETAARYGRRERKIYATFGAISFLYTVALRFLIVCFVGTYLSDRLHFLGLLLTAGLGLFYLRQPLRQSISAASSMITRLSKKRSEGVMATKDQAISSATQSSIESVDGKQKGIAGKVMRKMWRRRVVPLAITIASLAILLVPWSATVGNYGTLIAVPSQEAIIRAPEGATLTSLRVRPGEQIGSGGVIGQMSNFDLDEQIVQVQAERARANADYDRLLGELRTRNESAARAALQLRQRQHDYNEIDDEQRQIKERRLAEARAGDLKFVTVSTSPSYQPDQVAVPYPAAIAVLQSGVDRCRAQLDEAGGQRARARHLYANGIVPRSDLDSAETRVETLAIELAAARERLEAALIDHRRKHTSTENETNLARTDVSTERSQIEKLQGELSAMRAIITALEERRDLLRRKHAQLELVTAREGTVFGEELPRLVGHYFQKGEEMCHVADTRQLLLRIQVPEREIGDVGVGHAVRLKARAFPERVFRGVVSKIGAESEPDQYQQSTYRVELTIENGDGLLRPGMTAFARIEFGYQTVGQILVHKIKQALRPELWIF